MFQPKAQGTCGPRNRPFDRAGDAGAIKCTFFNTDPRINLTPGQIIAAPHQKLGAGPIGRIRGLRRQADVAIRPRHHQRHAQDIRIRRVRRTHFIQPRGRAAHRQRVGPVQIKPQRNRGTVAGAVHKARVRGVDIFRFHPAQGDGGPHRTIDAPFIGYPAAVLLPGPGVGAADQGGVAELVLSDLKRQIIHIRLGKEHIR